MRQQPEQSAELQDLQREERHVALCLLARALVAERKNIQHNLKIRLYSAVFFGSIVLSWSVRNSSALFGEALACLLVGIVLGILLSRRNNATVKKMRKVFQDRTGKSYQQLCSSVEPLLKTDIHPADLSAVLDLSRALLPNDWWMGEVEGRARFVALTTLLRLLAQAPESALIALEAENRAYSLHLLHWILTTPTGWYLDTELPIRLFLTFASTKEPGACALAEQVLTHKHIDERLREAAREYLATQEYLQAVPRGS